MTTFQHPRIARKFGPSFGRSDFIPSASVGYRELGKVKVDCRFCLSKSRWGFLEDDSYGCPGGILYMDLSFDQPKGCRLSSATVLVTLDHEDGPPVLGQEMQPSLLQVTNYFGPRQLSGQEKSVAVKSTYSLTPNVNVLGNGGGGIGKNIEKSQTYTSRWTFTGSLQPGKDKNKGRRGVRTMTYKTIKWELSENDLDPGASHSNVFHTAFAFGHEERPCYIHVEIDGKLQRVRDRIKKNLKFPPSRKEEEGKTTIRMDLEHSEVYTTSCLDPIAKGLARAMEMANYEEVPVELPSAIEPSFQEVDPIDGSPPAVLSTTANAGKPKHSIHRISPTSPLMLEAPSSVLQDPILQSLARAQASFPIAQRTQPVRLADRNIREGSSLSSASTLVEQDNRIEEVENDWPTVGKAEKENKVKDETVYQELIVRIIQSPALRLFIQILVHILDFFSMGQLFTEETPPFEQGKLVEDQEDYGNSGPGPEDKFASKKTSQCD